MPHLSGNPIHFISAGKWLAAGIATYYTYKTLADNPIEINLRHRTASTSTGGGGTIIGSPLLMGTGGAFQTSKPAKPQGAQNEKVKESAKVGQEAHRQEQAKLKKDGASTEVTLTLKDGTRVRKDAVKEDGTAVIIKPDTKTGQASAVKRAKLLEKNEMKWEKLFYNPKDPKYQPGSSTYIGPKQ